MLLPPQKEMIKKSGKKTFLKQERERVRDMGGGGGEVAQAKFATMREDKRLRIASFSGTSELKNNFNIKHSWLRHCRKGWMRWAWSGC